MKKGQCAEILCVIRSLENAETVGPGDVTINHIKTVHGAGSNRTNRMRRAMSFRSCGDQFCYRNRPGAVTQVGVTHQLGDGDRCLIDGFTFDGPEPWPGLHQVALYPQQGAQTGQERA